MWWKGENLSTKRIIPRYNIIRYVGNWVSLVAGLESGLERWNHNVLRINYGVDYGIQQGTILPSILAFSILQKSLLYCSKVY